MKRLFHILTLVTVLTLTNVSPAQGDWLPESAYVEGVEGHAQSYTLSCESRSAADLAAFWGLEVSESEFLQALPRSDNPDKGFVGDPNGAWGRIPPYSYGVHADPVAETLQDFGLQADAQVNVSWDAVRKEISAGNPVMVWVIGGMWKGSPLPYTAQDGSTVTVAAFEHTMLLTGYSADSVQAVDASDGQVYTYSLEAFLKSWEVLGNMVVFGPRDGAADVDEPAETAEKVVNFQARLPLVQRNVTAAAATPAPSGSINPEKIGDLGWYLLARLNELHAMHLIHSGRR